MVKTRNHRTSPRLRAILIACGAWVVVALAAVVVYQARWRADYELGTQGRIAVGVVTSTTPSDHLFCTYRYMAGERWYENGSDGCPKGVRIGSSIRVQYLPSDPQVDAVGSFIGDGEPQVTGTVFVGLICTLVAVVVGRLAYWRSQRKVGL